MHICKEDSSTWNQSQEKVFATCQEASADSNVPYKGLPTSAELEAFRARLAALAVKAGGRKALWGAAGISESNFSRLLGGERQIANPGLFTVKALAEAAGTTVAALLGEEGRESEFRVTPYDSNPTYRAVVDALEVLSKDDRDEIVRHILWTAERALRPDVAGPRGAAPTGDATTAQSRRQPRRPIAATPESMLPNTGPGYDRPRRHEHARGIAQPGESVDRKKGL